MEGRAFDGRAASVLLCGGREDTLFGGCTSVESEDGVTRETVVNLGGSKGLVKVELILRLVLLSVLGVKPNPPIDVRVDGLTVAGAFLDGEVGLAKTEGPSLVLGRLLGLLVGPAPSLLPGRLAVALPLRLNAEGGRGGGPMGEATGEKKLLRLLSLGVDGTFAKLSIVRSDRDNLGPRFEVSGLRGSAAAMSASGPSNGSSFVKP